MTSSGPSQENVNAIIELFSNRNYDKALEALKPLCKDYPKESLLHNIRGACYAGLSQFDAAIESYDKAIKINPKYYKAFFNLGSAFEEIGQIEKSITSYKKSLIIEPTYAEAHNNLGNALRQVGKLDEAANSFKEALVIKPDYVEALYSLGFTYQELGQLTEAVKCYESVLEEKPDFAEMHNNLGVLLQKLNQPKEAIKYLKQALIILPLFKEAHNNLGNVLKAEGNLDDAINSYQKAISIEPNYIEAHNNLGSVFFELNHLEDAAECYKKALTIKPDDAEGQYNLGFILQSLGQFDQAILCYQKVLNINPDYIDAHNNLGISFKEAGKFNEALQCYEKTINLNPEYAQAHNNIGNILVELGQSDKALESYRKAIEINPEYAEAHNNLGIIQMNLGHLNEAIKCYTKAIDLRTDYEDVYVNLGIVFNLQGQLNKSHEYYQKALAINPKMAEAFSNLGNLMIDLKNIEEAVICYENAYNLRPKDYYSLGNLIHTKMHLCDWSKLSSLQKNLSKKITNDFNVIEPFPLLAIIDNPELQQKSSEVYINHKFPENFDLPKISPYSGHDKIRIGYFSPDFRIHPVANLTAELYEIHNRDKFEVYAFSFGPDTKDEMNMRIKSGVDHFHDVRLMYHKEVALLSRSLEIDIAVDLGGFTQDTRTSIFAMRAAPIQVNYLGYSGTMGAEYIDYLISDLTLIPEDKQQYYSEKIAYLPDSFMVNDTKNKVSTKEFTRKEAGLPDKGFVYSCFNHHYKITPTVFASWMKILSQVDGSVLWLSDGNNTGISNLKNEAEKSGIDSKRLIFAPRLDFREDHLNRIKLSDLFLDTLPYNAHATTSDALQVGLPVLTHIGESFASRVAASLINSVNLPELITETQQQYEELAIELAKDPKKLKLIKDKLKNNLPLSPLYDTPLYAKQLESAYQEMYERSQKKLEPDHIYV